MVQYITASCHDKFTLTQVHIAYDDLFHELQNLSAVLSISVETGADVSLVDMSDFLLDVQERMKSTFEQPDLKLFEVTASETEAPTEHGHGDNRIATKAGPLHEPIGFHSQTRAIKVQHFYLLSRDRDIRKLCFSSLCLLLHKFISLMAKLSELKKIGNNLKERFMPV